VRTVEDLWQWVDLAVSAHAGAATARCPLGALAMEMVNEPGSTRAAVADAFSRWRDALQDALGRLQRRGLVRERWTPPQRADILLAAYEGGVLLSGVHGGTGALRLALVAAVEAMLVEGATGR